MHACMQSFFRLSLHACMRFPFPAGWFVLAHEFLCVRRECTLPSCCIATHAAASLLLRASAFEHAPSNSINRLFLPPDCHAMHGS